MSSTKSTAYKCKTRQNHSLEGHTKHLESLRYCHSQHPGYSPKLYEDIQRNRKISLILNKKTIKERDPEVPGILGLANADFYIITMSKDIKENLLSLHEKKGNFTREIETILKIAKWTIYN